MCVYYESEIINKSSVNRKLSKITSENELHNITITVKILSVLSYSILTNEEIIMAEQFLSRLNQIESSIEGLGETLKRMITVLGAITEIKSEVTQTKAEILAAISELKATTSEAPAVAPVTDELEATFKAELESLRTFVESSMESLLEEVSSAAESVPVQAAQPVAAPTAIPEPVASSPPPVTTTSSLPADKAMKIAEQLTAILKFLKMGCKSEDVQDAMSDAKEEILKIVPSDPVMIRIDKWVGIVAAYPKRKELQARDILKLKKEIKAEIGSYSPA